ncbi:hypothetical protein [Mycolicibacterium fortuitum]|uniref:hypothetical protein n=1 Tax=Mycolicibacterium fortuitum TaxID=1766 RepID=UPI001CE144CB|nr:hypothetical protein [Mycolicibacterium fortuitum]MCA4727475.1 hypothetical protein [Mycolicibacterium fortuitum]
MSTAIPTSQSDDPRADARLAEFCSLPLSLQMRALGDLAAKMRGWADRWEAEDRLRDIDGDLVDAVAGCLYAISSQAMSRVAPSRRIWAHVSEKSKNQSGYRAMARALLEHFDMRPRFALGEDDTDRPTAGAVEPERNSVCAKGLPALKPS